MSRYFKKHVIIRFFYLLTLLLILFSIFVRNSSSALASGNLISWWKFDETIGDAEDSSGSGYTLTNRNVTYTTGRIGNAAVFNGTDAYFSGTGPNLANSSFSISTWLYANNLTADQVWFNLGIDSQDDKALHLRLTTNGALRFGFYFDDLDTPDGVFSTSIWHQVIYTYNATDRTRTIYIDGVQQATDTALANFSGTNDLTIGSWQGSEIWNGNIDDVKVYNRVLTASEIADLSSGGIGPDILTPTPTNTSTNSLSSPNNPPCSASIPTGVPDLFQIDTTADKAKIYFTPVSNNTASYFISFGYTPGDMRFGGEFKGNSTGVIPYTINELSPKSTYYARVRAGNGCATGDWSNEMKFTTVSNRSTNGNRFYKNFPSQVISFISQVVQF